MLEFEKLIVTAVFARYVYYPEGNRDDGGIMSINRISGAASIEKRPEPDKFGFYGGHMYKKLRDMNAVGVFEESGMIAWY